MENQNNAPIVAAVSPEGYPLVSTKDLPNVSLPRVLTLDVVYAQLPYEECLMVTLKNFGNDVVYTIEGGENTMADASAEDIYVSNTNKIQALGTGDMNYVVHKRRVLYDDLVPSQSLILKFVDGGSDLFTTIKQELNLLDPYDVGNWNNFFQTNIRASKPFTKVSVDESRYTVILQGAENLSLEDSLFVNVSFFSELIDQSGIIVHVGESCFDDSSIETVVLNGVKSIGIEAFNTCTGLQRLEIPSCENLGPTTGNDNLFVNILGATIELRIPEALLLDEDYIDLADVNTVILLN